MTVRVTIEGIQEAQQANEKAIRALKPAGSFGQAVKYTTTEAHRRSVYNTPWDTGGLRAAHRMQISGLRGEIFIDPGAVNPRQGGARPAVYGAVLHGQGMRPGLRGGVRAFYQYTAEQEGPGILREAEKILKRGLP